MTLSLDGVGASVLLKFYHLVLRWVKLMIACFVTKLFIYIKMLANVDYRRSL